MDDDLLKKKIDRRLSEIYQETVGELRGAPPGYLKTLKIERHSLRLYFHSDSNGDKPIYFPEAEALSAADDSVKNSLAALKSALVGFADEARLCFRFDQPPLPEEVLTRQLTEIPKKKSTLRSGNSHRDSTGSGIENIDLRHVKRQKRPLIARTADAIEKVVAGPAPADEVDETTAGPNELMLVYPFTAPAGEIEEAAAGLNEAAFSAINPDTSSKRHGPSSKRHSPVILHGRDFTRLQDSTGLWNDALVDLWMQWYVRVVLELWRVRLHPSHR